MPDRPPKALCIRVNLDDVQTSIYDHPPPGPGQPHTLCLQASGLDAYDAQAINSWNADGGDLYHGPHLLVLVPLADNNANPEG